MQQSQQTDLRWIRGELESSPAKDLNSLLLLSIAESLEKMANPVLRSKAVKKQNDSAIGDPLPSGPRANQKPESADKIHEEINREYILGAKIIDPLVLENKIKLAKHWMFEHPEKVVKSDWTLRTSRVMTFISDFPDRKQNKDEQKTSQISI